MFDAIRSRRRVSSVLICLLGLMCCIASAAVLPADSPTVQLKPGKAAGTFHFVRRARATLTMDGKCDLTASFTDAWRDVVASMPINDPRDFTIEGDLRPGTYLITVSPSDATSANYWPSSLVLSVYIDKDGHLYILDDERSDQPDFVIVRRISVAPGDLAIADKARPALSWPAVPGASSYEGVVFVGGRPEHFHARNPGLLVQHDLLPEKECVWTIRALDHHGETLAEGRGTFFGQGTKAATVQQARPNQKCIITRPSIGSSYLGIRALATWADKSPTRTPPVGEFSIPPGSDTDFIPGIKVSEICAGSPAIDAGLFPGDVIVGVNDRRVQLDPKNGIADVEDFLRQLSALAPGSKVKLKVRRFPKEITVTATLAKFGATPEAPATAPAGR